MKSQMLSFVNWITVDSRRFQLIILMVLLVMALVIAMSPTSVLAGFASGGSD